MMSPPPIPSRPLTNPATNPIPRYIDGVVSKRGPSPVLARARAPRRMSAACQASNTAVITSSRWVFTTSVSAAPAIEPTIPGPTIHATARMSISPALR